MPGYSVMIDIRYSYGTTIKNCTFLAGQQVPTSVGVQNLTTGNNVYLYNSLIQFCEVYVTTSNTLIDDYNVRQDDQFPYSNYSKGSNSVQYALAFKPPTFIDGHLLPYEYPVFARWSAVPGLACGQTPPSEDLYGIIRPTTDSKKTRGCIQHSEPEYESDIVYSKEPTSLKFKDAMAHQIVVPITGNVMKFTAYVYREADYAGTLPQMIVKQPGESDVTVTDTGSAKRWNKLQTVITPNSLPPWVAIELRSNNTATSGNYAAFFGGLQVK
jgi:hypothetical protein